MLIACGRWAERRGGIGWSANRVVNRNLLYQPLSLAVAAATVAATRLLVPDHADYLRPGDLDAPDTGLRLLAVDPSETWKQVGLSFAVIATAVTATAVWWQTTHTHPKRRLRLRQILSALPWAVPLAAINAAAEEAIFRLAPAEALTGIASQAVIAVLSAVLFGVPHWFGNPGKLAGVLLAGFLGWLMCLSVLQTTGIAWASTIHALQDLVIFAVLIGADRPTATPQ